MIHTTFDNSSPRGVYNGLTPSQYASNYASSRAPIVLDLGSSDLRVGFATDPQARLRFPPTVGRLRSKKTSEFTFIGHTLTGHVELRDGPLTVKSAFDGHIITNMTVTENILDYSFAALGITGQSAVDHPIVMTEPILQLNGVRAQLNELMFEGYGVPALSYGVDCLFSLYHNQRRNHVPTNVADALIVSSSNEFTHVLPVIGGRPQYERCQRISIGSAQAHNAMYNSLIHAYPQHRQAITLERAQSLVQDYAVTSLDYSRTLQLIAHDMFAQPNDNDNEHKYDVDDDRDTYVPPVIVQLPVIIPEVKLDTEDDRKAREARRAENSARLRAAAAKKREERLEQTQTDLAALDALLADRANNTITEAVFTQTWKRGGFDSAVDVEQTAEELRKKLNNLLGVDSTVTEEVKSEAELYPLLNVDDTELTEDQLKEKRKQKAMKAAYDVRMKKKREKDEIESREKARAAAEEAERLADPDAYVKRLRQAKTDISQRMKDRADARSNRRSGSSRRRMAAIISMTATGTKHDTSHNRNEDSFGANDDDWDVYRSDSDSESDKAELLRIDEKLVLYDPQTAAELMERPLTAEDFQLNIQVDRVRVCELIYEPSIIGIDEAGLTETIRRTLIRMPDAEANAVAKCVFVCGGNTSAPGFDRRLRKEIVSIRPVDTVINVIGAQDRINDAWYGARDLAHRWFTSHSQTSDGATDTDGLNMITRKEYDECGSDYLKDHRFSNKYFQTPIDPDYDAHLEANNKKKRKR